MDPRGPAGTSHGACPVSLLHSRKFFGFPGAVGEALPRWVPFPQEQQILGAGMSGKGAGTARTEKILDQVLTCPWQRDPRLWDNLELLRSNSELAEGGKEKLLLRMWHLQNFPG